MGAETRIDGGLRSGCVRPSSAPRGGDLSWTWLGWKRKFSAFAGLILSEPRPVAGPTSRPLSLLDNSKYSVENV